MTYLSADSLAQRLDVSRNTVLRLAESGAIPKPIYLGPKLPRWDWGAVQAAIAKNAGIGAPSQIDADQIAEEAANAIAQGRPHRKGRR